MSERFEVASTLSDTLMVHSRFNPVIVFNLWLVVLVIYQPCAHAQKNQDTGQKQASLQHFLREYLQEHDLKQDPTTRYFSAFVDLNNDGVKEVIVFIMGQTICGTGGCTTLILSRSGSSFTIRGEIDLSNPPIRLLTKETHGWHSLSVWSGRDSVEPGHQLEVEFDGRTYQPGKSQAMSDSIGKIVVSGGATSTPLM